MTDYDYFDDDETPRGRRALMVGGGVVVALLLLWFLVVPMVRDDGDDQVALPPRTAGSTVLDRGSPTTPGGSDADPDRTDPDSTEPGSTDPDRTGPGTSEAAATTDVAGPNDTATTVASSAGTAVAPAGGSSTAPGSGATSPPSPGTSAPAGGATYATLPDGSPVPVVAIFDVETITLSGVVPSQAAADRLETLAIANSKFPATIVDLLTIDPNVPVNVAVRVLELTSARFPEGSAEIVPEHAAELDRVATVMNALPNVTVLVVGHADQRGDELENYRLSEERAQAVVTYLAGKGIDPSRLSSRAVGEADLVTLSDDEAALALNRRTEFVFSGLLVGA